MAAEAPAEAPQRAVEAAETTDVMKVFDALATDGAVKQKEFAIMIQLEAKAFVRSQIMCQLECMTSGGDEDSPLPVHPSTIKTLLPVIKRSFDRFDVAHMRTLLEMLFRVMDGNQNGKLEKSEFEEFVSSFTKLVTEPDVGGAKMADFVFKLVDKNGNGKLSLDEAQAVIDSLVEVIGTVITSVADVAEGIICSPEAAEAAKSELLKQMKDEGITPGDIIGECAKSEKELKPGSDWYHKKDTDEDLCKDEYDKYTGDDKGEYFLVDTPEKLKGDKKYNLYTYDLGAMVTRDTIVDMIDLEAIKAAFADREFLQSPMMQQMMQMMKVGREALGRAESNVGAQFYMKALEWSQGGVDEATFLCQVVPMMRESQDKEMEKLKAHPAEEFKKQMGVAVGNMPPQATAMVDDVVQQLVDSGEFVPALERGSKRMQEFNAELARTLFRFLDLDSSGRITTQEIRLLKSLLDAILHLGERTVHDFNVSNGEMKKMEGSVEDNAKELALAIFDVLDKDGDGKLSLTENVFFVQKLAMFILEIMKFNAHAILECMYDEILKALASIAWKKAGLEEVGKEQIMQGVMMAPMMLPMMMMQMQGGMQG